jgi:hypothetical protein
MAIPPTDIQILFTNYDIIIAYFLNLASCSEHFKIRSCGNQLILYNHWGKADDRNCNYGHPNLTKMADVESGKNVFCRLNCFYNVFMNFPQGNHKLRL